MKTVVTHIAPDVDAITSVWILKRFLPGWEDAEVKFVPAGKTLNNDIVDSDSDILHVDTGMGILDHHQTDEDTCAAKRCLEHIKKVNSTKLKVHKVEDNEALERMVEVVNDIDHFKEVYYPNPMADYYDFGLVSILDGWKLIFLDQNEKIMDMGLTILDGIYKNFQTKVWAEEEIKKTGYEFKSKWGKGIAMETVNDEVLRIAQRMGYIISVRRDPKKNYVRIKAQPNSEADLSGCYNILKKKDGQATWFLHASRKMLLNGSLKNPENKPSTLTLMEIVEILKNGK